jgi:fatty-acyl-CoA synthase
VPGVDVRFRRADGGLDPGGGSIEVRSPAMAEGYRHRDAEESERFVDGWYRTGDVGSLDAEGMLRIDGRAADIAAAGRRRSTCRTRSAACRQCATPS